MRERGREERERGSESRREREQKQKKRRRKKKKSRPEEKSSVLVGPSASFDNYFLLFFKNKNKLNFFLVLII